MMEVAAGFVMLFLWTSREIRGMGQFYFNPSKVAEFADLPWKSIENTMIFNNFTTLEDKLMIIRQVDEHLNSYYEAYRNTVEKYGRETYIFSQNITRMMTKSTEISADLVLALKDNDYYITRNIKDFPEWILSYSLIYNYTTSKGPFRDIENITAINTADPTTFFNKYQELREKDSMHTSQIQHILAFTRYLKWVLVKFYMTVKYANATLTRFRLPVGHSIVLKDALEQYSFDIVTDLYESATKPFFGVAARASPLIHHLQFNQYLKNVTYYEVRIFKRMFLETCYNIQSPHGYPYKDGQCSLTTNASTYCNDLIAGSVCPVWLPCENIRCQYLKEPTTLCLDQSTGVRRYEYFLPSHQKNTRECPLNGLYQLEDKNKKAPGYPDWMCIPCKCICQYDNTPYYYSTELVTVDFANNMVVVGAKLEIMENTLVIKVLAGQLLPNGEIDVRESNWLTPKLGERASVNERGRISIDRIKEIDLTRVRADPGEVITGLGLVDGIGSEHLINHRIGLQITTQKYNFREGTLNQDDIILYSFQPAEIEFTLEEVPSSSEVIVRDKFFKFTASGGDDGGATTVPLIDGRELLPFPLTPLIGVGLYLRGRTNGPLVGIEILTYDMEYSKYGEQIIE